MKLGMELFKPVALFTQVAVLAVTGVAFLIWMGVTNWQDRPGSAMGIIFILLALLQGVYSLLWWKQVKKMGHYQVASQTTDTEKHVITAESKA